MAGDYTLPVAALLTYGGYDYTQRNDPWPDYLDLGLTEEDIPGLIRMASDPGLNTADTESLDIWAPLHAWRALGQLKAVEAAEPLVNLFDALPDDDWLSSELRHVFALMGPDAIPALEAFLANDTVPSINRLAVTECLQGMAEEHPGQRDRCVGVLVRQLEKYETNGEDLNAFLVAALDDLRAVDAIGVIRKAFAANSVDIDASGDLEDVEISLGLRKGRSTPRPRYNQFFGGAGLDRLGETLRAEDYAGSPPPRRHEKVGRNDPCPCGSGKKYKKCCLQ